MQSSDEITEAQRRITEEKITKIDLVSELSNTRQTLYKYLEAD
jgi:hypothetical protein